MKPTLGVIIARMQIDQLHVGHKHLIKTALDKNAAVMVLIGDRDKMPGQRNPLPGFVRKAMVEDTFPEIDKVVVQKDQPNNERWSKNVDEIISNFFPNHSPTLYCSRDGFKGSYSGKYPVIQIDPIEAPSGTDIRKDIHAEVIAASRGNGSISFSRDYRRGMIAAAMLRFPVDFSCVDIAVLNETRTKVCLGQKSDDRGKWRFVGGFVDPADKSRKLAAIREAHEELGMIEIGDVTHIADVIVNDFRYEDELDSIRTDFFVGKHLWGKPMAGDDIDAVKWVEISNLKNEIVASHQHLADLLIDYLKKENQNV